MDGWTTRRPHREAGTVDLPIYLSECDNEVLVVCCPHGQLPLAPLAHAVVISKRMEGSMS